MAPSVPPCSGPPEAARLPGGAVVLGWFGVLLGTWRTFHAIVVLTAQPGAARLGVPAATLSGAAGLFCAAWAVAGAGLLLRHDWGRRLYTGLAYAPAVGLAVFLLTYVVCWAVGLRKILALLPWQWGIILVLALFLSAWWGTPGKTCIGLANYLRTDAVKRAMRH